MNDSNNWPLKTENSSRASKEIQFMDKVTKAIQDTDLNKEELIRCFQWFVSRFDIPVDEL